MSGTASTIPPMTDPLGRYWKQPNPAAILLDDTHALMSAADFNSLAEYSRSTPSGVYPGKMWKAILSDGSRYLCWYGAVEGNPKVCSNNNRLILIADQLG